MTLNTDWPALSIRQPWAWLIFNGKDVENRDWATKRRGRFYVHASLGMTRAEYQMGYDFYYIVGSPQVPLPAFEDLQRGGLIGSVDLLDCVSESTSPWFVGRYGFVLARPEPMPFVRMRGALGFFRVGMP